CWTTPTRAATATPAGCAARRPSGCRRAPAANASSAASRPATTPSKCAPAMRRARPRKPACCTGACRRRGGVRPGRWRVSRCLPCCSPVGRWRPGASANANARRCAWSNTNARWPSRPRWPSAASSPPSAPMTGVLGMGELLLGTPLDAKQRGYVESIRDAGHHLLRLVNDALDLARIEAGRLELESRPFAVQALLDDVAGLHAPLARQRGLQ